MVKQLTADYVIAGAGSAGCVLAHRLSANPSTTVCLLEAGPPDSNPFIRLPIGILYMMMSRKLNWRYFTEPQRWLDDRRLFWPRGKTLGGSSSSNAMVYTRGHAADYDRWAALGNRGWSYADLLPLFMRSEHHEAGASAYHGVGGPLNVAAQRSPNLLSRLFVDAAAEAGYPRNHDFNGAVQEGVGLYELTQKAGERCSLARAYLHPVLGRSNLTVLTGERASRVVLDGRRAVGLISAGRDGHAMITARREVILAAGAINTPQLLLLSGIGPEAALRPHGIALRHSLPGVGENLQDHLDVLVIHRCRLPVSSGISLATLPREIRHIRDYLRDRTGGLTTNGAEAGGFVKSGPQEAIPDLQFHFTPAHLHDHGRSLRSAARTLFGHGYSLHACKLRPRSRGHIGLKSADPAADPLIDPAYLSEPEDMATMVAGVKAARRVLAASVLDPYRGAEMQPGDQVQGEREIECFIRARAESIYHPVGTCRMGQDDMAVVDEQLRVHGLDGLRVVDASIMPTLVGGNTNAPTVMIAEKAADMILLEQQPAAAARSLVTGMPAPGP